MTKKKSKKQTKVKKISKSSKSKSNAFCKNLVEALDSKENLSAVRDFYTSPTGQPGSVQKRNEKNNLDYLQKLTLK